jgi:hypothetical protein
MFGVTESESFHLFPAYTVSYGLGDAEQRKILRSLLHTEFGAQGTQLDQVPTRQDQILTNPPQVLQTVYNEYRDFQQTREDKMVS